MFRCRKLINLKKMLFLKKQKMLQNLDRQFKAPKSFKNVSLFYFIFSVSSFRETYYDPILFGVILFCVDINLDFAYVHKKKGKRTWPISCSPFDPKLGHVFPADINECEPTSDCMQQCTNTQGSYTCSCNQYFTQDPNNWKNCTGNFILLFNY